MASFESADFRRIMGHYPTGVCAITAMHEDAPVAMIVGSFTSVSLKPPLVGFMPDRISTTWPKIQAHGRFCVNVLGKHQQDLCRTLSSKKEDKFANVPYHLSDNGSPVLDDVVAWIDCTIDATHEAGDHLIVIGMVHALEVQNPHEPMLFLRGSYGMFQPVEIGDFAV